MEFLHIILSLLLHHVHHPRFLFFFFLAGAGDDVDFSKVSSLAVSIVNKLDHTQRGLVNTEGMPNDYCKQSAFIFVRKLLMHVKGIENADFAVYLLIIFCHCKCCCFF